MPYKVKHLNTIKHTKAQIKTVEPIGMQFACRVVLLQGTILALPVKYERQRCGLEPIKLVRLSLHDTSVKSDVRFYLCFGMFNGI